MLEPFFSPYQVAGLDLANRFVMAPMTRKQSPGGVPTETVAEYYRRRAAGGLGLIITEGTLVEHRLASPDDTIPRIAEDTVDAWRMVLDEIRKTNTKTFVQLWYQGSKASPGISAFVVKEDGAEAVSAATEKDRKDILKLL